MLKEINGIPISGLTNKDVVKIYEDGQSFKNELDELKKKYEDAVCNHLDREALLSEMLAKEDGHPGERETMLIEMVHERNETIKNSSERVLAVFNSAKLYKQLAALCGDIVAHSPE